MKFIFTFLILISISSMVRAQDIIVTITGDTSHVKIDHANDQFVYYRSETTKRGELDVISRMEIASILYNYEAPDRSLLKESQRKERSYNRFEIWFLYGFYYLPNDYSGSPDFKDYFRELQNGTGFMTGAQFFISKNFGFGMNYSRSQFSNSIGNVIYLGQIGYRKDDITIQYVGAGIVARLRVPKINSYFEVSGGLGYSFYNNQAAIIEPYTLTGNGIGGHLGLQFLISVGSGLFIPINGGVSGFDVKNIHYDVPNSSSEIGKQIENAAIAINSLTVTRLSASIGLLFAF